MTDYDPIKGKSMSSGRILLRKAATSKAINPRPFDALVADYKAHCKQRDESMPIK